MSQSLELLAQKLLHTLDLALEPGLERAWEQALEQSSRDQMRCIIPDTEVDHLHPSQEPQEWWLRKIEQHLTQPQTSLHIRCACR